MIFALNSRVTFLISGYHNVMQTSVASFEGQLIVIAIMVCVCLISLQCLSFVSNEICKFLAINMLLYMAEAWNGPSVCHVFMCGIFI